MGILGLEPRFDAVLQDVYRGYAEIVEGFTFSEAPMSVPYRNVELPGVVATSSSFTRGSVGKSRNRNRCPAKAR